MNRWKSVTIALLALVILGLASSGWAEKKTVKGTAPWEAVGQVFMTGPEELLFQGDFEGVLYLETAEGPLDGILLLCPATYILNLGNGSLQGQGKCIMTGQKGHAVYSDWSCTGERGFCKGEMTLNGGSGPFAGITGSGEMSIRSVLSVLAADLDNGELIKGAAGLALWPKLTYEIPEK